jgi:hypothetical protein
MSSNSLNLRNVKDAIYNNIYLISENGGLDNIRDLISTVSVDDIDGLISVINSKAPKQNPEFTGTVTVPDGSLSIDDVLTLRATLESKAPKDNPTLTGTVSLPGATFYTGFGGPVFTQSLSFTNGVHGISKS